MTVRRAGFLLGGVTLVASAVYLFLYLSRWEWNRAMIAGLVLVASETALFAGAILVRIERLEERLDQRQDDPVLQELRANRGTTENRFDWLAPPDRLGVFIPVLLGAGAVISALAWVVERVARLTVGRATEHVLAMRLSVLRLPDSLVGPASASNHTGLLHPTLPARSRGSAAGDGRSPTADGSSGEVRPEPGGGEIRLP